MCTSEWHLRSELEATSGELGQWDSETAGNRPEHAALCVASRGIHKTDAVTGRTTMNGACFVDLRLPWTHNTALIPHFHPFHLTKKLRGLMLCIQGTSRRKQATHHGPRRSSRARTEFTHPTAPCVESTTVETRCRLRLRLHAAASRAVAAPPPDPTAGLATAAAAGAGLGATTARGEPVGDAELPRREDFARRRLPRFERTLMAVVSTSRTGGNGATPGPSFSWPTLTRRRNCWLWWFFDTSLILALMTALRVFKSSVGRSMSCKMCCASTTFWFSYSRRTSRGSDSRTCMASWRHEPRSDCTQASGMKIVTHCTRRGDNNGGNDGSTALACSLCTHHVDFEGFILASLLVVKYSRRLLEYSQAQLLGRICHHCPRGRCDSNGCGASTEALLQGAPPAWPALLRRCVAA